MKNLKCIAFDCFGTVFDMAGISQVEIIDYVRHVRKHDFSPYEFPEAWWDLPAHPDSPGGIEYLKERGYLCVALSNGSHELLANISEANGIKWDKIIDLAAHKVYKPHIDAYRTVEKDTGVKPENTLMVTANPTFGDVEGAEEIGMQSMVIRKGFPHTITDIPSAMHLNDNPSIINEIKDRMENDEIVE